MSRHFAFAILLSSTLCLLGCSFPTPLEVDLSKCGEDPEFFKTLVGKTIHAECLVKWKDFKVAENSNSNGGALFAYVTAPTPPKKFQLYTVSSTDKKFIVDAVGIGNEAKIEDGEHYVSGWVSKDRNGIYSIIELRLVKRPEKAEK